MCIPTLPAKSLLFACLHIDIQTYHDSMKKLGLMTDAELAGIFGHIDLLVPVHQGMLGHLV